MQRPKTRARRTRQILWVSPSAWKTGVRSASATAWSAPALTAQQRRATIQAEADGALRATIIGPAARPILEFCRPRLFISPVHLFALSLVAGVFAALFLMGGGSHPLLRLWAGIFLFGAAALSVCGGELAASRRQAPGTAWSTTTIRVVQGGIAAVVVFFALAGATRAAAVIDGSFWIWLVGIAAMASTGLHALSFDAARTEYVIGAGGGAIESRETLLELSIRAHEALLRGDSLRADFWRYYAKLRRMQQSLVSRAPQGSADAFWRLNRRRMVAWTVLCGDAQLFMIAVAAVVSTFWPDALVAALWLSAAAGNALLGILLLIGWKNAKSRG